MKKLFLATMLGLFGFAANANQKVTINDMLPLCPGMTATIQFVSYQEGSCILDIYSPVYPLVNGQVFDMCDPATWAPGILWMPSYETFAAIICVQCTGMTSPFCTIQVGLDCNPGHACLPLAIPPAPFVGCCFGTLAADCTPGGGGTCMQLNIHP